MKFCRFPVPLEATMSKVTSFFSSVTTLTYFQVFLQQLLGSLMFLTPSRLRMLPGTPAAAAQTSSAHETCRRNTRSRYQQLMFITGASGNNHTLCVCCISALTHALCSTFGLSRWHQLKDISLVLQNSTPRFTTLDADTCLPLSHTSSAPTLFQAVLPIDSQGLPSTLPQQIWADKILVLWNVLARHCPLLAATEHKGDNFI